MRLISRLVIFSLHVLFALSAARADDAFAAVRNTFDGQFRKDLAQLAEKCDELKLTEQARVTRAWARERDPGKIYLFVVREDDPATKLGGTSDVTGKWRERFLALRKAQAAQLFELAQKSAAAHDCTLAWQLVHETLHEDPDHAAGRAVLGHKKVDGRWRFPSPPPQARVGRPPHPKLGWPAGKYWRVETAHYEIATNQNAEAGLALGRELEDLVNVWQQLFVRYWTTEEAIAQRFTSPEVAAPPAKKMQVVLFRDRQSYTEQLAAIEPQIQLTQGIYLDREHTVFLYAGDERSRATWHHEATHQLFQETNRTPDGVATKAHIWIVEGIALYLESLQNWGDGCFTTGGLEAERLQFARYRLLNEKRHVPLAELAALSREALQKDPQVRQLYSQAAGQAQFLMHAGSGRYRERLVDYLGAVYANADLPASAVGKLLGASPTELDEEYRAFLNVTDADLTSLARSGPRLTKLCLGNTEVTVAGVTPLAPFAGSLDWLDLAHRPLDDDGLAPLVAAAPKLAQLNLEGTNITDASLPAIAQLKNLAELDLSQTAVTDAGVKSILPLKKLKVLFLTSTKITDASVPVLSQFKNLETLGIKGTALSPAALGQLEKALPKWKRN